MLSRSIAEAEKGEAVRYWRDVRLLDVGLQSKVRQPYYYLLQTNFQIFAHGMEQEHVVHDPDVVVAAQLLLDGVVYTVEK